MKATVAVCTGYKIMLRYAIHLRVGSSAGARHVDNPHVATSVFKEEPSLDTELTFLDVAFGS